MDSTVGLKQYKVYCRHIGTDESTGSSKIVLRQTRIIAVISIGTAELISSIEKITVSLTVDISETRLLLLLSHVNVDHLRVQYNNLEHKLPHSASGMIVSISRLLEHSSITLDSASQCSFTEAEVRRLHEHFGHLHQDKLFNHLRRADAGKDTRECANR